jgi:hypothetical protein
VNLDQGKEMLFFSKHAPFVYCRFKANAKEIGKRKEVYLPFRREPESFGSAVPATTKDKENHG